MTWVGFFLRGGRLVRDGQIAGEEPAEEYIENISLEQTTVDLFKVILHTLP